MGRGGSFSSYRGTRGQRPCSRSQTERRGKHPSLETVVEAKNWCPNCGLLKIKNLMYPQCPICGAAIEGEAEGEVRTLAAST